jgi:hypothetical protein
VRHVGDTHNALLIVDVLLDLIAAPLPGALARDGTVYGEIAISLSYTSHHANRDRSRITR